MAATSRWVGATTSTVDPPSLVSSQWDRWKPPPTDRTIHTRSEPSIRSNADPLPLLQPPPIPQIQIQIHSLLFSPHEARPPLKNTYGLGVHQQAKKYYSWSGWTACTKPTLNYENYSEGESEPRQLWDYLLSHKSAKNIFNSIIELRHITNRPIRCRNNKRWSYNLLIFVGLILRKWKKAKISRS